MPAEAHARFKVTDWLVVSDEAIEHIKVRLSQIENNEFYLISGALASS